MNTLMTFLTNFWFMITESAPWLLLGFLLAGAIGQLLPSQWITKSLGQKGFATIFRAAFIGAPLPLCSCGVIPTAMGIRRAGASRGATASFLVATPETGVDSVSLSYALMGPIMAIARPVSAIISAIVAGTLVEAVTNKLPDTITEAPKKSCCGGAKAATTANSASADQPAFEKITEATSAIFKFSFGKLLKDITYWLAIGLLGAAAIKTFVPTSFFTQWGSGLWAMLVMIAVGIPMYICATASTPLAASLMLAGVSPGAALVFMLTGPATNIATLGVIKNELGGKALLGYLAGVILTAVAMGLLLDFIMTSYHFTMPLLSGEHMSETSLLGTISGILLILLALKNYLPKKAESKTRSKTTTATGCSGAK